MFGFGKKKKPEPSPEKPAAPEPAAVPASPAAGAARPATTPEGVKAALEAVQASRSRETEMAFWEQMMRLPQWHFAVDPGQAQDAMKAGGMPPILTYKHDGGERSAAVFSSPEIAGKALNTDDKSAVVSIATHGALGFVCAMHETVSRIVIDYIPNQSDGFGTDLWALPGLFNHFNTLPPIAAIDALSKSIGLNRHPMEYTLAYRMIAASPQVFVAMQGERPAVMPLGEELSLIGFTDQGRAARFAEQVEGVSIVEAKPDQFSQLITTVVGASEGKVTGAVVNPGPTGIGVNGEMFAQAIAGGSAGAG